MQLCKLQGPERDSKEENFIVCNPSFVSLLPSDSLLNFRERLLLQLMAISVSLKTAKTA